MKRVTFLVLLVIFGAGLRADAQSSASDALRRDIDFARSKVYPSLVNIAVVSKTYSGGRARRFPGAGSGVIVSAGGHILTNFHVAGNTTRITCTLPNGERIDADVVAHDPLTDLSVLKLRLEQRSDPTEPVPFSTLGDSEAIQVGDYVLAMGNPLTLSSSLTLGVVSNTKRVFTDFTGSEISEQDLGGGEKTGMFTRWLQHDALILPGNSGGPLVNLRGEVVGINELGGSGVGFAIPSNLAAKVLNQVLTFGEVRRGWLGFSVMPVSKLGKERGALVSSVVPQSPAHKAGIEAGDRIVQLGKTPTDVRFFEQVPVFYQHVAELPIGRPLKVRYVRGGKEHSTTVAVERMEKFLGAEEQFQDLGLTVREITGPMALSRRMPTRDGVLVTGIRPGHAFEEARPNIRSGDVIVGFGGHATPSVEDFRKAIAEVRNGKEEEVAVEFLRNDQSVITLVELGDDDKKPRGGELPKAWFGARTQVMTPGVAKAVGLEGTRGFRVTEVYRWTKAKEGGLQTGDVIVEMDDEELDAYRQQDARDLQRLIEDLTIGEKIDFVVMRDGKKKTLTIEMQDTPAPSQKAESYEQKQLEFKVRELTFMDRIAHKLEKDDKGLLVIDAVSGGWANYAGLRVKDIIKRVNESEVVDVESFEQVMDDLMAEQPKVVSIFVQRGPGTHFVFIEPVWSEIVDKDSKK